MDNTWDTGKWALAQARSKDDFWACQLGKMDKEGHS